MVSDRGQAHTLEAIVAALVLITSIGFALQMTAVTPLSASTSSQHLENQVQATGKGILASTAESGALKEAVLYYNESNGRFHGASDRGFYSSNQPANRFGRVLNRTYNRRNIAYNVYVVYHTDNRVTERRRMIFQGDPSDHAVTVGRTVTLVDDDHLVGQDGDRLPETVGNSSAFYIPDAGVEAGDDRPLYNQVRVEVVAWRI